MFAKTEGVSCNVHYIASASVRPLEAMSLFICALSGKPKNKSRLKVGNFLRSPAVTRCCVGVSECLCMWARTLMCRRTSEPSSFSWRKGKINSVDWYCVLFCIRK